MPMPSIAKPLAGSEVTTPQEIVRASVIAKRYDVTERCVFNWKDAGTIPHIKIGKTIRFRLSDVISAIEGAGAPAAH